MMVGMPSYLPPPSQRPILFAHRGGKAHGPENTLPTFQTALSMGATGLESDAWLTSDGQVVLDHRGHLGPFFRKRRLSQMNLTDLPDHLPTLNALYESVGTNFDLSLDVKDPAAFTAILKIAASFQATSRLWLCFPHWETAATWREHNQEFHLVDSPTQDLLAGQHERRAVQLSSDGFDAINMPEPSWTAGHVTLFHRFGLRCLAWDAQQPRQIDRLLKIGVDGIYGDHVERLVTAEQRFFKAR